LITLIKIKYRKRNKII